MKKNSRILIIGHGGLAGAALLQRLHNDGCANPLTFSPGFDPLKDTSIRSFFNKNRPEYVFLMDVRSGGILANLHYPADLMYANLRVQNDVIHSAWETKVKKLIFVASSCSYPKKCAQPIKEEYLLTGSPEPTSEAFAIAKIAGIKMCQYYNRQYKTDFISVIPATIYGPGDDFDPATSHVLPALIRKFREAIIKRKSSVTVLGSGKPRREFLHVNDMTEASIFLMNKPKTPQIINVGSGADISICELAELLKDITGFKGTLRFDTRYPDGAHRKLLDIHRLTLLDLRPWCHSKKG